MTKLPLPFLLIALAASAAAAPVPDDAKAPVFAYPTRVGTTWVYQQDGDEVTEVLAKARSEGDETAIAIEARVRDRWTRTEHLVVSPKGLFYRGTDHHTRVFFPWCVLDAKARPGERWHVRGGEGPLQFRLTYTVLAEEWVEVPAGRFRVLKVEEGWALPTPQPVTVAYYASGVGFVKETKRADTGMWLTTKVLKSFAPVKD